MTSTPPPRLLILACSATKRSAPGLMPARDRYDGPLWRTLRATDPDGVKSAVAFFSAKYGLGCAATPIADYEARLTHADAQNMIAALARAPRANAIGVLADMAGAPFEEVALAGGRLYLSVMRADRRRASRRRRLTPRAHRHHQRPHRTHAR